MLHVAQSSDRQSWRMQATNSPDLAFRLVGETVDWYQRVYKQNFKTDGTRLSGREQLRACLEQMTVSISAGATVADTGATTAGGGSTSTDVGVTATDTGVTTSGAGSMVTSAGVTAAGAGAMAAGGFAMETNTDES